MCDTKTAQEVGIRFKATLNSTAKQKLRAHKCHVREECNVRAIRFLNQVGDPGFISVKVLRY